VNVAQALERLDVGIVRLYGERVNEEESCSAYGELLGKIKLPGKDPAANLAFGKGKHRSTLYVLDETSVTAVELPGTRGARVGRERKFDVGRVRYKTT